VITGSFTPGASSTVANSNSLSVPVTVPSGSNQLLLVLIAQEDGLNSAQLPINSVTRGGSPLTRLTTADGVANNSLSSRSSIWYQFAPAQSNTAVSIAAAGQNDRITATALVFDGVLQSASGLVGAGNGNTSGQSISTNITPAAAGSWVVDIGLHSSSNGDLTATGTDHIEYSALQSVADMTVGFGRRENLPSAGQITLGWDQSTSGGANRMTHSLIAFAPVPEPATVLAVSAVGLLGWRRWRAGR
jgi:hypothetical protein